eukprot:1285657-Rhodomonas_salina.3
MLPSWQPGTPCQRSDVRRGNRAQPTDLVADQHAPLEWGIWVFLERDAECRLLDALSQQHSLLPYEPSSSARPESATPPKRDVVLATRHQTSHQQPLVLNLRVEGVAGSAKDPVLVPRDGRQGHPPPPIPDANDVVLIIPDGNQVLCALVLAERQRRDAFSVDLAPIRFALIGLVHVEHGCCSLEVFLPRVIATVPHADHSFGPRLASSNQVRRLVHRHTQDLVLVALRPSHPNVISCTARMTLTWAHSRLTWNSVSCCTSPWTTRTAAAAKTAAPDEVYFAVFGTEFPLHPCTCWRRRSLLMVACFASSGVTPSNPTVRNCLMVSAKGFRVLNSPTASCNSRRQYCRQHAALNSTDAAHRGPDATDELRPAQACSDAEQADVPREGRQGDGDAIGTPQGLRH